MTTFNISNNDEYNKLFININTSVMGYAIVKNAAVS